MRAQRIVPLDDRMRGEGAWLESDTGARYLDLAAGIAVVAFPLYVTFVASTHTLESILSVPMPLALLYSISSTSSALWSRREESWAALTARRRLNAEHPIEQVGEKLRAMMPWISKNKLVDQSKN